MWHDIIYIWPECIKSFFDHTDDIFWKGEESEMSAKPPSSSGIRTENKELNQKQASSSFSAQAKQMFNWVSRDAHVQKYIYFCCFFKKQKGNVPQDW